MTAAIPDEVRERRKIREIARDYRRAGYRVVIDPSGSEIPPFLGGYRPDLVAIGDTESVIVKVKSTRGFDRSESNRDVAARVAGSEPHPRAVDRVAGRVRCVRVDDLSVRRVSQRNASYGMGDR